MRGDKIKERGVLQENAQSYKYLHRNDVRVRVLRRLKAEGYTTLSLTNNHLKILVHTVNTILLQ